MRSLRANQTSFTAGEIAPSLFGRIDVNRYYSAAASLLNVIVRPQGGVRRRPGMKFVSRLADGADGVRLIPFAFNIDQTYLIALTAGAFVVIRSDGLFLARITGCPWNATQARQMNRAQSADTLILCHPDVAPSRIRRGATETDWTCTALPLTNIPNFDFGAGPEPVISATRGWPECVTFHQSRLWLAGLRSRPATFLGSRIADFFNFDEGTGLDDQAINATIDSDQLNAIHQIASGRALQLFTSGAEHTVTGDPLTPKTVGRVEQTRRGIKRFVPTVEVDGAQLFVQRGGAAFRQFLYNDTEQAWRSDLASLLAPHLITDPIDAAVRKTASLDDADNVLLVNPAGTVTTMTTLRAQEIVAFSRWQTDGQIVAVAALQSGQTFFATYRGSSICIESWEPSHMLDASVRVVSGTPQTAVAALEHLNGRNVAVVGDGSYQGIATVTAGVVTLPQAARVVEVGLPFTPQVTSLPIEPRDPSGAIIGRRMRLHAITARVQETSLFRINEQSVIFRRVGPAPAPNIGGPPPIFTGDIKIRGLCGYAERNQVQIDQPIPGQLELLALSYDMEIGD